MSTFEGAVYDPPADGLPYLAALFVNGEFKVAYPATSEADGEKKLLIALKELRRLAERDAGRL